MSAWTDSLRAASFRGVPFEVDAETLSGGRRVAVHEIPGGDQAVTEDVGRRPRTVTVQAYCLGESAIAQSIALLQALESPGSGLLVHPLYGEIAVSITDYQQTDTWSEGYAVAVSFSAVEAGELEFVSYDTGSALESAIDVLETSAAAAFAAAITFDGFGDTVLGNLLDDLEGALSAVEAVVAAPLSAIDAASDVLWEIQDAKARVQALASAPDEYAAALRSVMRQVGDLLGLRSLAADAGAAAPVYDGTTPDASQSAANAYATQRLQVQLALAAAANWLRSATLGVYDDALEARDALADLIAAESEIADGDAYDALRGLRLALVEDVTRRVASLPRVTTVEPAAQTPAVALAWQLYGDETRAQEIADRNGIVHPLFLPAGALQVLTS